jgi:hypothetical protein
MLAIGLTVHDQVTEGTCVNAFVIAGARQSCLLSEMYIRFVENILNILMINYKIIKG